MTAYAATANSTSLSFAFINVGPSQRYHPEQKAIHRSIHVDPISPPSAKVSYLRSTRVKMNAVANWPLLVEVPGTAPGSAIPN